MHHMFSEENFIQIWNNGKGIPVEMHREEKVYVPAMIFGQLLTSSNYDDDERKVTGGRNGYGAKLCNIFSKEFTVETACKESGRMFKQVCAFCVPCKFSLACLCFCFVKLSSPACVFNCRLGGITCQRLRKKL